jgi:beta-aspartyl-peptidase (threonine type)
MQNQYSIALHGGAGTISPSDLTPELEKEYRKGLELALQAGYSVLKQNGTAIDAVVASVKELENNPLFNAGKGSVFNHIGKHEMDSAVMEGKLLNAGTVCGVKNVKNPVLLAKAILDHSEHVMMAGEGAREFAEKYGIEFEEDAYFFTEYRHKQWMEIKDSDTFQLDHSAKPKDKIGTVGAVACDSEGNLAAATSTGGMTNKQFGRIGDSPVIGAGTYANNYTCAISCTGHGEPFLKSVVAHDISCLMSYKGFSLREASQLVVMEKLVKIQGEGGLVAIDSRGNIEMPFNSEGMYRASINKMGEQFVGIYK